MLPYRFQKTSRSTSIFCDQWLDGVACSNVAVTLCSLELQHILRFWETAGFTAPHHTFSVTTAEALQSTFRFFSAAFPGALTSTIVSRLTVFGWVFPAALRLLPSVAF
jgi:hypothetical protein